MRLEVDLRFDATPQRELTTPGVDRLDLRTLVSNVRSPNRLWRLLRQKRYVEVSVVEGDLPLSGVQAVCLVLVAAVPTRRFAIGGRDLGRPAFLGRGLSKAVVAISSELFRSAVLGYKVARSSQRPAKLPLHTASTRKALYLRVDPTLNWMGLQVGGAATHTTGVIRGLLENGVDVDVLASERPYDTSDAEFVEVPLRRMLQLVPGLAFAEYSEQFLRVGRSLAADFVYQRHQLGSDAGLRLAERLGVPFVLEFNGSEIWIARNWASRGVRFSRPLGELERRNLLDASLVVVVSSALRDVVVTEGAAPDRVLVNPNGVDVAELMPYRADTPGEWRKRKGLPDQPTVGFIGTFELWHGVHLLPALVEAVPGARWVIIGDGPLFPEVRDEMTARSVEDRVVLSGLVERTQALELLACCDVCVSPHVPNPDGTPFFGSPTKLFEYMGLRKAIVASDLGQIGDVLTHEETALLCMPGDVPGVATGIRRLLADPAFRDRLANAAFDLAASEYTWKAHVRRILDALVVRPTSAGSATVDT